MFRNLFKPDSSLLITMNWITDCIFLSLFWLLGCFGVVTAGASFAALYDAAYRTYRQSERNSWQRFLYVFRSNLRAGIVPTLLLLAAFWGLLKGGVALWNLAVAGNLSWALFAAGALLAVLGLGVLSVLFPLLSRFENGLSTLLKNTLLLALANLPRTLALGVLNAGAIFLCVRFVFPFFFLPALASLLGSLLLEPMFKPYM
ncbi:MAG: DUF624 domain-containing protein [Ruminococcaceae bacterium]|nr:DUF624 domain-containing protein [Oscillospiraceae bacterium]